LVSVILRRLIQFNLLLFVVPVLGVALVLLGFGADAAFALAVLG
jgi:hypothetical protein